MGCGVPRRCQVRKPKVVLGLWRLEESMLARQAGVNPAESDNFVTSVVEGACQIHAMCDCPS